MTHETMTPLLSSAVFFAAGVIGAALKAFLSNDQGTLSRKSIGDIVLGGLVGILYPALSPVPLPETFNLLQQAAMVAGAAYMGSDIVQNALQKFGIGLPGVPTAKVRK